MAYKCQKFEDNGIDATEAGASKHTRVDAYDNKEGQGSDKYQNKGNMFLFFFFPKKS